MNFLPRPLLLYGIVFVIALVLPTDLRARGARLFKSGPIQITADGRWVWVANEDHDSVSRVDTSSHAVLEVPLPFYRLIKP